MNFSPHFAAEPRFTPYELERTGSELAPFVIGVNDPGGSDEVTAARVLAYEGVTGAPVNRPIELSRSETNVYQ